MGENNLFFSISAVYEGKGTLKGQIGVASIDPSTTEFHLFNFPVSEGFTSLKSLLQVKFHN